MIGTKRLPTTTATPVRLCAFQATRRPQQLIKTTKTAFGSLTIDARLGQAHADLMECVMFFASDSRVKDERLEVVIDPHKVRRAMGVEGSKYSASSIKTFERDLLRAVLDIETSNIKISGHIVDKIVASKIVRCDRRAWATGDDRQLQCWIFSEEWTEIVKSDMPRFYDPSPLCRIEHGSVSAIARHVLTHQHQPNGGWKLDGLMQAAGVERRQDKVRQEMRESADTLAELGIFIDGDRIKMSAPAPSASAPAPFFSENVRTGPIF